MPHAASKPVCPEDLAALSALNARFIHNYVTNDVSGHDAILHPQFLYIGSHGGRVSRADYLAAWATGFDPEEIVYWDARDEAITIVGDVALVRSANKCIMRRDGADMVSMTAYTDVYVRHEGRWLCLQAQITRVAPGFEPSDSTIISVYRKGLRQ